MSEGTAWTTCVKRQTSLSCCTNIGFHLHTKAPIPSTKYWLWPQMPIHMYMYTFFPLTTLVNEPNIGFLFDEKRRISCEGAAVQKVTFWICTNLPKKKERRCYNNWFYVENWNIEHNCWPTSVVSNLFIHST